MHPVYYDMSEAELIVCDFLKTMRVYWIYEQPVFLADNMERPRLFAPDFFLPELGIYIEVMGNPAISDYERRMDLYEKNYIPIIFIAPFHDKDWRTKIIYFIEDVNKSRYNKIKRIKSNLGSS